MKKLLSIVVLGLLLSGNAYAKDTLISCSADKNTIYPTFIFEINDRKKDIKLVEGLAVNEDKKLIKEFSKNNIDFEYDGIFTYSQDKDNNLVANNNEKYINIVISRMTGRMSYLMDERNNDKLLTMESFTCKKTEPIF